MSFKALNMYLNIMVIISEDSKCECVDNELLYADIKWCLFSQNIPAQLLDAVTDLAQAQHKNICVPSTTEAVLEIHSMQKSHHSSALQTCDSRAGAMHSLLPLPWCVEPFPSARMGALSRMCPMLSCTALGEQPHAMEGDPEQGRLAGAQLPPALSKAGALASPSAEKMLLQLLKRIGRKRRMRFCCVWAHTARQSWGSGLGGRLVLRSSHSPQIMIKLSLFVRWRTWMNFLCSLYLMPRKGIQGIIFWLVTYITPHHCLSCNLTWKHFSAFLSF